MLYILLHTANEPQTLNEYPNPQPGYFAKVIDAPDLLQAGRVADWFISSIGEARVLPWRTVNKGDLNNPSTFWAQSQDLSRGVTTWVLQRVHITYADLPAPEAPTIYEKVRVPMKEYRALNMLCRCQRILEFTWDVTEYTCPDCDQRLTMQIEGGDYVVYAHNTPWPERYLARIRAEYRGNDE